MDSLEENNNALSDNEELSDAEELLEDECKSESELFDDENKTCDKDSADEQRKDNSKLKVTKKRVVRNPKIILNFERLTSEKGLPALTETFEKFKFRGKHYEKEDLTCILKNLQHWMCHTLYPGYDFETCIAALEKLGKKRVVQTHLKKLRREAKENFCHSEGEFTNETESEVAVRENDFDVELKGTIETDKFFLK